MTCEPPPAYDKIYEVEPSSVEPLNPPRYPAFLHSQRSSTRQADPLLQCESQTDATSNTSPSKTSLESEGLAKFYIVFFAAVCWVGIICFGIISFFYKICLIFLCCCLIPFPFLIYGYQGIEERLPKLIIPLIVFSILLFVLIFLPLSIGCLYYAISYYPRDRKDQLMLVIASIFVLLALIPGPLHAIGTFIYVRHQIVLANLNVNSN
ncbi:hypothetical protein PENTCL1PPCAC_25734 [Pristionchus entomophagus]|uniref:G protein-coupled receptor n=1 Tax=Pristionchus entomophagus TaxID=358040 RepID=A0AAV5U9L4_9BILA|nr:hypothetical protein PENTCL1PPCAC_25734 [Pristionchus entomophagus]